MVAAFGTDQFTRSMRETDRTKAAAKALPIIAELNQKWAALRASEAARLHAATPTESDLLGITWDAFKRSQAIAVAKREAVRNEGPSAYSKYVAKQESAQGGLVRDIVSGRTDRWEDAAIRILQGRGFEVDRDDETFRRFTRMLAEATVSAIDVENRRDRGELAARPNSAVLDRAQVVAEGNDSGHAELPFTLLVEQFLKLWNADRSGEKQTNTEQQKRATFRLFAGFCGDVPIGQITVKNAAEFRDAVKLLDPNWCRSPSARGGTWESLSSSYGNHPTGLSDSTMNRHMATLQKLWDWARKRGHCSGDNPFAGFHRKIRDGRNAQSYRAWENVELACLFNPPPKRVDLTEVMLVGLFTGMRLNEIASLTWKQLRSEAGVYYFQIDDSKTAAGVRQVPVHRALEWLLKRERGRAEDRVWSTFNLEGPGKKPGADASREFSRFKAQRGFGGDRQKTFHSFRKNVTRIMERAGVPENEWAQVFGHERGFTYRVYNPDGIALARKSEIIELISYPGLNLPIPA
ncbi:tyrosine-type recombinase/integrase [Parablastomonas sp. CN1-191]|uniref:tyrosine-type recombinase/integrase n=1 Tax=Parablastomonas sp. CN1-191 TaxID=3400908 RepID=UPI003BF7D149